MKILSVLTFFIFSSIALQSYGSPSCIEENEKSIELPYQKFNDIFHNNISESNLKEIKEQALTAKNYYELNIRLNNFLVDYINNYEKSMQPLSGEDVDTFIAVLSSWAYIIEHDFTNKSSIIDISQKIATDNDVIQQYSKWTYSLISTVNEANEKINSSSRSINSFARKIGKFYTVIGAFDPEEWKNTIAPRDAIKAKETIKKVDKLFSDQWYYMIRYYVDVQEIFYTNRSRLDKLIEQLQKKPENSSGNAPFEISRLKKYAIVSDSYYKSLDSIMRTFVFDTPIEQFSNISLIRCQAAKYGIDDKAEINRAFTDFLKIRRIEAIACQRTIDYLLMVYKNFKSTYNEKQIKDIENTVKLSSDWYNLYVKIKSPIPEK
jgi:hypothetical protein